MWGRVETLTAYNIVTPTFAKEGEYLVHNLKNTKVRLKPSQPDGLLVKT